jgi:thiol-disulfide isomerase/thioredoxin
MDALRAAAAGKVTLVTFWATWCDACRAEMPALNRLADHAAAHGGEVIGVAVGESRATVTDFLRSTELHYPQLTDETYGLFDTLGGEQRIPRTLVLDRSGAIVFSGATFDRSALAAFRSALAAN